MVARRRFTREFKREAVRLVVERQMAMAHVARDLDVHVNVLRGWVRAYRLDPRHAFTGEGQQKPEDGELTRLRREVVTLRAERDILKVASSLKIERVNRRTYHSCAQSRQDIFDDIERFYNPRRRDSTLRYVSPAQFEQQMAEASAA